jgi:hypothetical protein
MSLTIVTPMVITHSLMNRMGPFHVVSNLSLSG